MLSTSWNVVSSFLVTTPVPFCISFKIHWCEIFAFDASHTMTESWWWTKDIPEEFVTTPMVEVIGQRGQSFLIFNVCTTQLIAPYVLLCIQAPTPSGEAVKEITPESPFILLPWHLWYCTISQHSCSVTGRKDVVKTVSYPPKKNPSIFFVFIHVLQRNPSHWACGYSLMKNLYFLIIGVSSFSSWQYDGSLASKSPIDSGLLQSHLVIFNDDVGRMTKKADRRPSAIFLSIWNIYVILINICTVVASEFSFLNYIY